MPAQQWPDPRQLENWLDPLLSRIYGQTPRQWDLGSSGGWQKNSWNLVHQVVESVAIESLLTPACKIRKDQD